MGSRLKEVIDREEGLDSGERDENPIKKALDIFAKKMKANTIRADLIKSSIITMSDQMAQVMSDQIDEEIMDDIKETAKRG